MLQNTAEHFTTERQARRKRHSERADGTDPSAAGAHGAENVRRCGIGRKNRLPAPGARETAGADRNPEDGSSESAALHNRCTDDLRFCARLTAQAPKFYPRSALLYNGCLSFPPT